MKSALSRFLPWFFKEDEKRVNLNGFGSKLDSLTLEVWDKNHRELLKLDNDELPASVWGFSLTGRMSEAQMRVHGQLNPTMEKILDALRADGVSRDKINFVDYLVRNLVALKFAYLRDLTLLRKQTMQTGAKPDNVNYPMNLH